ncbi:mechanosensitive ion channel domain-containing protein [Paenibacillus sp.]|uniref:mechanosensitive ion channel family protein n=1 Tax=Paenibacillus sp. TaxID=58172 RepID=UPI0028110CA3|nr:mechanosensitive ion channel domain-containing protein [Paenibacillus sp.]
MDFIREQLIRYGASTELAGLLSSWILVVLIAGLGIVANGVAKKVVHGVVARFVKRNRFKWDDMLLERKVFQKLSHIVPVLIIYYFSPLFPSHQALLEKAAFCYFTIVGIVVLNACLNAADDIYRTYEVSKLKPIKGYIQVVKMFIFLVGAVAVIATLIGQSPIILLSGLGALSAVLMLIFKDSILGLVAGVQLASNDMVRVGDWIEMPKYDADGDVIDISLNTVKVRNFDMTITTIPSYALISDSFRNWRGMQASGGRRIKRSITIDASSIAFCSPEMIERFRSIHFLTEYVTERQRDIEAYNAERRVDTTVRANGRQMTNIGVFRAYVLHYLQQHPNIHQEMTLLVRQLAPGEYGLPLEIYAFTNTTAWASYETIQADIFDHVFAVAPEFGLRVFQNPTGYDLQQAGRSEARREGQVGVG